MDFRLIRPNVNFVPPEFKVLKTLSGPNRLLDLGIDGQSYIGYSDSNGELYFALVSPDAIWSVDDPAGHHAIRLDSSGTPQFVEIGAAGQARTDLKIDTGEVMLIDPSLGLIAEYLGVGTQGAGVPPLYRTTSSTGNTGALSNVISYTPPVTGGTYRILAMVDVTAWTTPASFTVQAAYKDGTGNARTETLALARGSTGAIAAAITAIDRWYSIPIIVQVDSSQTAITVSTAGTFTGSPVYNFAATLERLI